MLHGQVVTVAFSQKLEDSMSSRLYRMKYISNQSCTRNLEIIYNYGNKKKLWPNFFDFYLSEQFVDIFENAPCAKIIQIHLEMDKVGKMKYTCSIQCGSIERKPRFNFKSQKNKNKDHTTNYRE